MAVEIFNVKTKNLLDGWWPLAKFRRKIDSKLTTESIVVRTCDGFSGSSCISYLGIVQKFYRNTDGEFMVIV